MSRDPELQSIRTENRRRLGMAGTVPGMGTNPLAMVGQIKVGSSFPSVEYTYDPSQPSQAPSSNGWFADFVTKSIIRPYIEVPSLGFKYDPGSASGAVDYSGIASAAIGGAAVIGAGAVLWVLYRAFITPRRTA